MEGTAEECDDAAAERRNRAARMAVGDRGVLERYTALAKACEKAAEEKEAKDAEVATLQVRRVALGMPWLHLPWLHCGGRGLTWWPALSEASCVCGRAGEEASKHAETAAGGASALLPAVTGASAVRPRGPA